MAVFIPCSGSTQWRPLMEYTHISLYLFLDSLIQHSLQTDRTHSQHGFYSPVSTTHSSPVFRSLSTDQTPHIRWRFCESNDKQRALKQQVQQRLAANNVVCLSSVTYTQILLRLRYKNRLGMTVFLCEDQVDNGVAAVVLQTKHERV